MNSHKPMSTISLYQAEQKKNPVKAPREEKKQCPVEKSIRRQLPCTRP